MDGYFNIQTFLLSYVDMKQMEKIDFYTLQWFYLAEKIVWRAGDSSVSYQRSMRLSIHNDSKRGEL